MTDTQVTDDDDDADDDAGAAGRLQHDIALRYIRESLRG